MRKAFTALAVATAAFTAPMLTAGTAYAAVIPPVTIIDEIVVADIGDIAIPGGCTLTYIGLMAGTPIGPVVSAPPGSVTINYDAAVTYVSALATHTRWYIRCI